MLREKSGLWALRDMTNIREDGDKMGRVGGKEKDPGKRQRRNSLILVVSLLAVFFIFYVVQRLNTPKDSLKAVIQIDGKTVHTMDLGKDDEYVAGDPDGDYNIVIVKDGCVMVQEANCANQVCVKTGQIQNEGEVIACLPHKMIIYLE